MRFRGEYWFLSNFYPCDVVIGGISYGSVESAFQGEKARMCGHDDLAFDIADLGRGRTDEEALRIGASARSMGKRGFTMSPEERRRWSEASLDVMLEALRSKFSDPVLADRLRSVRGDIVEDTGDRRFPDRIWGVDASGRGENRLGKLLMQVRDEVAEPFAALPGAEYVGVIDGHSAARARLRAKNGSVLDVTVLSSVAVPESGDVVEVRWGEQSGYRAGSQWMPYGRVCDRAFVDYGLGPQMLVTPDECNVSVMSTEYGF